MNAAKSSIPFGCIKRQPPTLWFAEVEEIVSKGRQAFATAHKSDEDRQTYISASRYASSIIAKAETWQATCSSFSPKCNFKSVYSLLRSVAGSSSSSSPNFPNCSSHRKSASVFADYLRFYFLFPRQRPCVSEPGYFFLSSAEPRVLRSLIHPFALSLSLLSS